VIDRALMMAQNGRITDADLRLAASTAELATAPVDLETGSVDEAETLRRILARFAGNQSRAAKAMGIARSTLIAKIKRYGIGRPQKD
jgi:transcriptional regulator of acetoin/glycerol metabolism